MNEGQLTPLHNISWRTNTKQILIYNGFSNFVFYCQMNKSLEKSLENKSLENKSLENMRVIQLKRGNALDKKEK